MALPGTPSGWLELRELRRTLDGSSFARSRSNPGPGIENTSGALYNNSLPEDAPKPSGEPRGWTIFSAGLLLIALALVVIYTSRRAFLSPLALVVVAAIGLAALLLQLRFRRDIGQPIHAPFWLNVLGLVCAVAAVFADVLHLSANLALVTALGAVACFAISGAVVLHALRSRKT